jgi:hypothetical protein
MVTVTADIVAMRIGLAQEMYKARVGETDGGTDALY